MSNDNNSKMTNQNPQPNTNNFSTSSVSTKVNIKQTTVGQLHNKYNLKYNINPTNYSNSYAPQTYNQSTLQSKYNTYLSSFPSPNIQKTNIIFTHNFGNNSNNTIYNVDNYSSNNQFQHNNYSSTYDHNKPLKVSAINSSN